MNKAHELWAELKSVLGNRLLDVILPPLFFLLINGLWGLATAMVTSLFVAAAISYVRLRRGESLRYALAGVVSLLTALALTWILGRAEGYFIPGLVNAALTFGICALSLFIKRPLTAWSSYLVRRWPLEWYWHPRVRPAYTQTTLLWTAFFGVRFLWQYNLFRDNQVETLAWVNALLGWPALIILLVITYLVGIWMLRRLKGPSVEEFRAGTPPPWHSQRRGF